MFVRDEFWGRFVRRWKSAWVALKRSLKDHTGGLLTFHWDWCQTYSVQFAMIFTETKFDQWPKKVCSALFSMPIACLQCQSHNNREISCKYCEIKKWTQKEIFLTFSAKFAKTMQEVDGDNILNRKLIWKIIFTHNMHHYCLRIEQFIIYQ